MADDSPTPLPSASAEPTPDDTPQDVRDRLRMIDAAARAEYATVHGTLPAGLPPDGSGRVRAALAAHQHTLPDAQAQVALCLSGGGIRSATYGLGVLQGLARAGVLGRCHFLSSVSGGGYIASWLTAWRRRCADPAEPLRALAASAGGTPGVEPAGPRRATHALDAPEAAPIHHLRAYSNYLSPATGLSADLMALVGTFCRNLVLHWSVLLPLLAAVLLLPRLLLVLQAEVLAAATDPARRCLLVASLVGAAALLIGMAVAYMAADLPGPPPPQPVADRFRRAHLAPLGLAALLLTLLAPLLTAPAESTPITTSITTLIIWALCGAGLHLSAGGLGWRWRRWRGLPPRSEPRPLANVITAAATGAIGAATLAWLLPALGTQAATTDGLIPLLIVGPPLTLAVFWLAVTLHAGWTRHFKGEEDREWWARAAGQWMLLALAWTALTVSVLWLPAWVLQVLPEKWKVGVPGVGVLTVLSGVMTSAIGYWSQRGAKLIPHAERLVERLQARALDLAAAAFLLLLTLSMAVVLAVVLHPPGGAEAGSALALAQRYRDDLLHQAPWPALGTFAACIGLAAVMAWFIGVNTFSLHGMYANRLIRAYLGASQMQRRPHPFTGFDPHDNLPLAEPAGPPAPARDGEAATRSGQRLFPVIQAALNLVQASGDRLEWQQRKAASFTLTPLHCGSDVLGHVPTAHYSSRKAGGLSLGRAMAISGAAASPNMGYHSSTLVAMVMSLFNVRLGWWLPNPRARRAGEADDTTGDTTRARANATTDHAATAGRAAATPVRPPPADDLVAWPGRAAWTRWGRAEPRFGLGTLLGETLARTSAQRDFVYLSDGGHFENLGLYEMVRRRCRLIIVSDATADAGFSHDDLQSAVRKIRIDLGISISFERGLPTVASVRRNGRPWCTGRIAYGDADGPLARDGLLVYLKPALWDGLPLDLLRYAQSLPTSRAGFPHQSTADQFFDEAQFESYRMLGLLSALQPFADGRWPPLDDGPDHRDPPSTPSTLT
ncbi:MAG: hypothetical protein RLY78_3941 [Pseudomonadota bacterium]